MYTLAQLQISVEDDENHIDQHTWNTKKPAFININSVKAYNNNNQLTKTTKVANTDMRKKSSVSFTGIFLFISKQPGKHEIYGLP